ncbi:hypothetical protein [Chelativorans sp. Marseille-P2723]|uniref:hypothetical protein n=1 Tax=Chelativorans sp. Marseille-P2723 TaxID=2709133 RepID=UPI001FEFC352|nr:hypothetical protein [Chelativorans sp. Marseille-P2723]
MTAQVGDEGRVSGEQRALARSLTLPQVLTDIHCACPFELDGLVIPERTAAVTLQPAFAYRRTPHTKLVGEHFRQTSFMPLR